MTFDEVRVIHTNDLSVNPYIVEEPLRTPAQKHTDLALSTALEQLNDALEAITEALEWLTAIGADVPRRFRDLPVELTQLRRFTVDEQGRRG